MPGSTPLWLRYLPLSLRRHMEGRVNLHAMIHNTGWLLADQALRMVMGILVGAWVARYLGPTQYGELSYVIAFVAFFQVITLLGLDGIAVRDIARNRLESPAILGTVLWLRLVIGFICWGASVAGMAWFRPGDHQSLILTAIVAASLIFQSANTIDLWFQSQTQSKRTVLAKNIAYLIISGLKVWLILAKAPLVLFAVAGLIEMVLSAIALAAAYRIYPSLDRWKWDTTWAGKLLCESWPYMLSELAIIIYMRIDQIMLREMIGEGELGVFSAALPLSASWYFISMMIAQSIGPTIARKKQSDPIVYERSITQLFSLMWWTMLPLTLGIALLSRPMVVLLYGPAFSASAEVLAIHVFANIPVALGVAQGIWIINEQKNTLSLTKTVMGAVSNILLNLLLIPKYGAIGAAVATVASQSISSVLSNIVLAPEIFKKQLTSIAGRN